MLKTLTAAALILTLSTNVFAQAVIPSLKEARRAYPTPMSKSQLSEMMNRAALQHPGWGMLEKIGGNVCPTPYPGVTISCDWMVDSSVRWGYDLIIDQEGGAVITDRSDGAALAPGQRAIFPWPAEASPAPAPAPTPDPTPSPAPDLQAAIDKVLAELREQGTLSRDQAERVYQDLVARQDATFLLLQAHDARARSFMDRVGGFFTDLRVLAAGLGLLVGKFLLPSAGSNQESNGQ